MTAVGAARAVEMVRLAIAGRTAPEIAATLGLTEETVRAAMRAAGRTLVEVRGIPPHHPGGAVAQARIARAAEAYDQGATLDAAAELLGVSRYTTRRLLAPHVAIRDSGRRPRQDAESVPAGSGVHGHALDPAGPAAVTTEATMPPLGVCGTPGCGQEAWTYLATASRHGGISPCLDLEAGRTARQLGARRPDRLRCLACAHALLDQLVDGTP